MFVLILVTQLVLALFSIEGVRGVWPVIIGLLTFIPGLVLIAAPHSEPFPMPWVFVVLLSSLAINALVLWNLPASGWPGYADWSFGAAAWLYFFLAFRGRIAAAWVGWVLLAALTELWAFGIGETPLQALGHVDRHAGTILTATLFRILLSRVIRRITALQAERLIQVSAEAASLAEIREREAQALRLTRDARPVLERIARGEYLGPHEQDAFRLLEANLRDALRGGDLASPEVANAATAARQRGGEVVLLDDRQAPLPEADAIRVEEALLDQLSELHEGRLTARLLPTGREELASIVRTAAGSRHRIDLAAGEPG